MTWAIQSFALCLITWILIKALPQHLNHIKQGLITTCFLLCMLMPTVLYLIPSQYNQLAIEVSVLEPQRMTPIKPAIIEPQDIARQVQPDVIKESTTLTVTQWIGLLWLMGALFVASRWIRHIYHARKTLIKAQPMPEFTQSQIPVYASNEANTPYLYAFFRKGIVIPSRLLSMSAEQLDIIIQHELCHHRRKDHQRLWLTMLVTIVYWFNPLIHCLGRNQRLFIENQCDLDLLHAGMDPFAYAQTLVACARNQPNSMATFAMAAEPNQLEHRVKTILDANANPPHTRRPLLSALVSSLLLITGCVQLDHTEWVNAQDLATFVTHDLPSLKQSKLQPGQVHVAALYDGQDDRHTFVNLKIKNQDNQASWLKLGPLKKFNEHIHTWQFNLHEGTHLTGEFLVEGVSPDGVIDGVALGMIMADTDGAISLLKSKGQLNRNDIPNVVCAWPLGFNDYEMIDALPQLTTNNPDTVERLICGAQLVADGTHQLN